ERLRLALQFVPLQVVLAHRRHPALCPDEPRPLWLAVLVEPVGEHQTWRVIVVVGRDVRQEGRLHAHFHHPIFRAWPNRSSSGFRISGWWAMMYSDRRSRRSPPRCGEANSAWRAGKPGILDTRSSETTPAM